MTLVNGGDVREGNRGGAVSGAISGAMFDFGGEIIANGTAYDSVCGFAVESMSNGAQAGVHMAAGAVSEAVNAALTGGDVG